MEPRILLQGSLTLVGLAVNGSHAAAVPESLWKRLSQRVAEIPFADPDVGTACTNGKTDTIPAWQHWLPGSRGRYQAG